MVEIKVKTRKIHENSLKNLRPQKAGTPSHNPKGRPRKADCLVSCLKSEGEKLAPNGKQTNDELIASVLVAMATRGNLKATEIYLSWVAPKPTASVDVTTKGETIGNGHIDIPEQVFRDALAIVIKSGVSKD